MPREQIRVRCINNYEFADPLRGPDRQMPGYRAAPVVRHDLGLAISQLRDQELQVLGDFVRSVGVDVDRFIREIEAAQV